MRSDRDHGMVTAELAVCLPVLVLLLAVALSAVSVAGARIRVDDVAREAARLAARGDDAGVAQLTAREAPKVHIAITRTAHQIEVVASARPAMLGGVLPPVSVSATSVAAVEPTGVP